MNTLYVEGVGLWCPQLPSWEVAVPVLRGERALPEDRAARPSASMLPPNERRRAPDTVAISLDVASNACAMAGLPASELSSVFTSAYGDIAITDYMCATLAQTPDLISPTRFHHSVHNAAAGYWSIATGCMAPYTAVSAWQRSFAMGLMEAIAQVHGESHPVLLVAYDVDAKGPLAQVVPSRGLLGAAMVLSPRIGSRTLASVEWITVGSESPIDSEPECAVATVLAANSMHPCLALLEVLAGVSSKKLRYALGPQLALDLRVSPIAR